MGNNEQAQKPKTSKMAIASLLIPIVIIFVGCISENINSIIMSVLTHELLYILGPLSPLLGILALIAIKQSNGRLTGRREAIYGITLSVMIFLVHLILLSASGNFFPHPT